MTSRVVAALAAGSLAVAGCGGGGEGGRDGSESDQVKAAVLAYYRAFGSGDSAAACDRLSATAISELEKSGGSKDCVALLDAARRRPAYARIAPKLGRATVRAVRVTGSNATAVAKVPGAGQGGVAVSTTVPLKKEGGAWKIVSTSGGDAK